MASIPGQSVRETAEIAHFKAYFPNQHFRKQRPIPQQFALPPTFCYTNPGPPVFM